ncbi:pRiA4b ORF-3-like protein [Candidatus Electrothrix marina]|uniref:PRiA4b ORF-3-like protein n=1 Tax=Candidatus Electrothrix marina TaxID=1859130 RepID=A0A444JFJ9_9BACT|nr:pRiA4b ORF-3-like protein [Candidatus Electrothrix marina]
MKRDSFPIFRDRRTTWGKFDFGDDWWHQINVVSITEPVSAPKGKYPKIIKRKGDSPPQYPDVA